MSRTVLVLFVALTVGSGCAGSPPVSPPMVVVGADEIQDLLVVPAGESRFNVVYQGNAQIDPALDEVLKWIPYAAIWRAVAQVVVWGVNWLGEAEREAATAPHVRDLAPRSVVAEAFARALTASGRVQRVRVLDGEPVGTSGGEPGVLLRLTVPNWGLLHVREGKPDLLSGFADVRAQLVVPETGVVLWEHQEDITHPERLPLQAFSRELTRRRMIEVLERAGRRLASEYLYARGVAR